MNKLDFKSIYARNFICFGPEGIKIDFKKFGNIIFIKGNNFDEISDGGRPGSNGSGKSSLLDIITYTLYGKTVKKHKKLTHKNVIHNKIGKKLHTEVIFDNYKVIRCRKPDSLALYEETSGEWVKKDLGITATQKEIERIVGLTYEAFVNVMFFDDVNDYSFLESDTPTKRKIVENLLSLERYREFGKKASELLKDANNKIKFMATEYDHLLMERDVYQKRITDIKKQEDNWKVKKSKEIKELKGNLQSFVLELKSTDSGKILFEYEEAQKRISELNLEIPVAESKRVKLAELVEDARAKKNKLDQTQNSQIIKFQEIKSDSNISNKKIEEYKKSLADLHNLEIGSRCNVCHSIIDSKSYVHVEINYKETISEEEQKVAKNNLLLKEKKVKIDKTKVTIDYLAKVIRNGEKGLAKLVQDIKEYRSEVALKSTLEKPESGIQEKVLEERILEIRKQIESKEKEVNGPSPYVEIIESAIKESDDKIKECKIKKRDIDKAKHEVPYYKFWVDAFGDNGIRKFVIDGIVPMLNDKVSYWLYYLINNKIKIEFNNQLEETIERNPNNGDPFTYYAMSRGEKRRLNLAVALAFSHIMTLSSGNCPSCIFLDEVSTNVDPNGIDGIYNMIFELSKDRQVFVTTHDQHLQKMLDGFEAIDLHKRDGFTKIAT